MHDNDHHLHNHVLYTGHQPAVCGVQTGRPPGGRTAPATGQLAPPHKGPPRASSPPCHDPAVGRARHGVAPASQRSARHLHCSTRRTFPLWARLRMTAPHNTSAASQAAYQTAALTLTAVTGTRTTAPSTTVRVLRGIPRDDARMLSTASTRTSSQQTTEGASMGSMIATTATRAITTYTSATGGRGMGAVTGCAY